MSSHSKLIKSENLWQALLEEKVSLIDVRAPVEFHAGHIPESINLPILTDSERAEVGTVYKQQGSRFAIALGHQLVSGEVKEARIRSWIQAVKNQPKETIITCFRGGMRSGLSQEWLADQGVPLFRLEGGYKKMRQLMMAELENLSRQRSLVVMTGKTGSGKTAFLRELRGYTPILDLEKMANHRGSAFGAEKSPQPSQSDFENRLALAFAQEAISKTPILVEDESRMIGSIAQPEAFFENLRKSSVFLLEEPFETRIENTYHEYIVDCSNDPKLFSNLKESIMKIQKKLGGQRAQELLEDLNRAETIFMETTDLSANKVWIEKILSWYYDPLYEKSFQQRKPQVQFRGSRKEIFEFIKKGQPSQR